LGIEIKPSGLFEGGNETEGVDTVWDAEGPTTDAYLELDRWGEAKDRVNGDTGAGLTVQRDVTKGVTKGEIGSSNLGPGLPVIAPRGCDGLSLVTRDKGIGTCDVEVAKDFGETRHGSRDEELVVGNWGDGGDGEHVGTWDRWRDSGDDDGTWGERGG
jgi:hypothetical protein